MDGIKADSFFARLLVSNWSIARLLVSTTGVRLFFQNNRVSFLKKVDAFQMLRMSKGNYRISYTSFEGRLGSLPSATNRFVRLGSTLISQPNPSRRRVPYRF